MTFNGVRLSVARQRRSFTKKELGQRIGIEPRSISGFEAGQYVPTDENVSRIALTLAFPREFFFGDDLDRPREDGVSFRSMSKMSARQRDAAIAAGSIAFGVGDWIERKFDLPRLGLADLRDASPEVAATSLRQHWGIGERPIKNMIHLLEAKGVRVFSLAENCREVDAYSLWRREVPYVFLNTVKSAEHRRYDAAHELAHLVLHKHASPNGLEAEQQANEFAAAFLMPRASILSLGRIAPSVSTLIQIKKKWTVSVSAITRRLYTLGLMTEWHYRSLFIEIQRLGYRTKEPHEGRPESSQVWQKVFALLREEGSGLSDLAAHLLVPQDELVKLVFGLVTVGLPSSSAGGASIAKRPPLRLVHN
jgi:Zn-dependent peptidase ImmA (M78 family)/transcriptional regulator with XRE-family HTH domain